MKINKTLSLFTLTVFLVISLFSPATLASDSEAMYQANVNGEWLQASFSEALQNVYDGGTVKLVSDVSLTETVTVSKTVKITSEEASDPKKITSSVEQHGYLLKVSGSFAEDGETYTPARVIMENIIVDGGSESGITASRALIAVGDNSNLSMKAGYLTLGEGAVICNNNNTTQNGAGGGVCIIVGGLTLNGGEISGNTAYQGGGVVILNLDSNTITFTDGTISGNTAATNGGGICQKIGTVIVSDNAEIKNNSAVKYGGGVYQISTESVFEMKGGSIIGNSSAYGGGIYVNDNELLELSGGLVTENTASRWGGGMLIAPNSSVAISGTVGVYGNINTSEEPGENMYLDGYEYNGIHFPNVTIGQLASTAKIVAYSWLKPTSFSYINFAASADEYTVTQSDMNKLSYEDGNYGLTLDYDGNVLLKKLPYLQIDGDNKNIMVNIAEKGVYTVIFADYNADGSLNMVDIVTDTLNLGENTIPVKLENFGADDKVMLWKDTVSLVPLCGVFTQK